MKNFESLYITLLNLALYLFLCLFLLYLATIINCDFWVSTLEFIQEGFHLYGCVSQPIQTLFLSLFFFLLSPLFSEISTMMLLLFHFLASLPTTFSPPVVTILHLVYLTRVRVSFSASSIFGIKHTYTQLSAPLLHISSILGFQ